MKDFFKFVFLLADELLGGLCGYPTENTEWEYTVLACVAFVIYISALCLAALFSVKVLKIKGIKSLIISHAIAIAVLIIYLIIAYAVVG